MGVSFKNIFLVACLCLMTDVTEDEDTEGVQSPGESGHGEENCGGRGDVVEERHAQPGLPLYTLSKE